MENLRSKPFWDRSPLESLAAGHKKIPLNFKLYDAGGLRVWPGRAHVLLHQYADGGG